MCHLPESPRILAEARLIISLSVQELTTQGLARRHIGVHLYPGASNGLELAGLDATFDLVEQKRVVLLEPV